MNTFISMLRGINVSGQKKIRMADLRSLYGSLGLVDAQTYVQSGNVIFDSLERNVEKLRQTIETQIEVTFGFFAPVLIRSGDDFRHLIGSKPFAKERSEEPTKVMVTFLYERPDQSKLNDLSVPENDTCEFIVGEQEIFLFCPGGYGRTKLSNTFFERKLGVIATTRNWKTVNTLFQMVSERKYPGINTT